MFFQPEPILELIDKKRFPLKTKDKNRPLLKNGDPEEILSKLHEERKTLYEEVSDHIIETENKSSQEVAAEIINLVKG